MIETEELLIYFCSRITGRLALEMKFNVQRDHRPGTWTRIFHLSLIANYQASRNRKGNGLAQYFKHELNTRLQETWINFDRTVSFKCNFCISMHRVALFHKKELFSAWITLLW